MYAMKISSLVQDRYSEGAKELQPEICSSVKYNTEYLKIISATIIEPNLAIEENTPLFPFVLPYGEICTWN